MAGDVDDVVYATTDPVIPFVVPAGAVTGELLQSAW